MRLLVLLGVGLLLSCWWLRGRTAAADRRRMEASWRLTGIEREIARARWLRAVEEAKEAFMRSQLWCMGCGSKRTAGHGLRGGDWLTCFRCGGTQWTNKQAFAPEFVAVVEYTASDRTFLKSLGIAADAMTETR